MKSVGACSSIGLTFVSEDTNQGLNNISELTTNTLKSEMVGRTIGQAVSRWLPTAAVRVRPRVWSSEICGGQNGAGVDFLRVFRFPLPIFIPPNSPSS
jgi:hypothetical protein